MYTNIHKKIVLLYPVRGEEAKREIKVKKDKIQIPLPFSLAFFFSPLFRSLLKSFNDAKKKKKSLQGVRLWGRKISLSHQYIYI